ncbi:hypothetical protein RhiJN_07005 [Ceratobasidium sp. AG-Ba]|nr:hypothetical protein RhiJN_07005 [Ceratobasidium sp. AG-Ba]QRW07885.1 hypothetical protein RhiLY_06884 [Ceratobasidium sp. AG-Ba]
MFNEEPAVNGKRSRTRTPGGLELDEDTATKKAKRDKLARNKFVREAAKVLQQEDAFEEPSSDDNDEIPAQPKTKPKPKPKTKLTVTPESSEPTGSKGKAWRQKYLMLISIRDEVPLDKLESFPDDELEVIWKAGEGAALRFLALMDVEDDTEPVPPPATSTTKPAPAPPAPPKGPTKPIIRNKAAPAAAQPNACLQAATPKPKRLVAPSLMKSTITAIGSPRVAIEEAETQSRLAAVSPLIDRRKRNLSVEHGEPAPKRPQLTTNAITSFSQPPKQVRAQSAIPALKPQHANPIKSRSNSLAPSAVSGASARTTASRASSLTRAVPTSGHAHSDSHSDPEIAGLGDGTSEEYIPGAADEHEHEDEEVLPATKNKRSAGRKKVKPNNRPTTAKFKESGHDAIINIAVERAIALLAKRGFYIEDRLVLLAIHEAWDYALEKLGLELDEWPIENAHITVIRNRIGSFRGRGRTRIKDNFTGVYDLDISDQNDTERVKKQAKSLLPVRFHQDPEVPAGSEKGYFRHPYLVRAVCLTFFTGEKAPGPAFPDEFELIEPELIAFTCTQMEDLFGRFAQYGCYVKEKRKRIGDNNDNEDSEPEPEQETPEQEVPGGKRSAAKRLMKIYERHLADLRLFQRDRPGIFVVWQMNFSKGVWACAGQQREQVVPKKVGSLGANAFADEPDLTPEEVAEQLAAASVSYPPALPMKSRASSALTSSKPAPLPHKPRAPTASASSKPASRPAEPPLPVPGASSTDEVFSEDEHTAVATKDGRQFHPLDNDGDVLDKAERADSRTSHQQVVQQDGHDDNDEDEEPEGVGNEPIEEDKGEAEADGELKEKPCPEENVEQTSEGRNGYELASETEGADGGDQAGNAEVGPKSCGGVTGGMGDMAATATDAGVTKASWPAHYDSGSDLSEPEEGEETALPAVAASKPATRSTRQQTAIARQLEVQQPTTADLKGKGKETAHEVAAMDEPKKGAKRSGNNGLKRRK